MHSSTDVPLDAPFQSQNPSREAIVQDRPTLGAMPMARSGPTLWLLPRGHFLSSSPALALVVGPGSSPFLPAFPIAPLVLVVVYSLLGVYSSQSARAKEA